MWTYDSNGNLVWQDNSYASNQPASMWSDPVSTQNAVNSPSQLNPSAGTWGDVLAYGLSRGIDVATIRALQPDNNQVLLPGQASVYMGGQPVASVGISRGMLMLMAIGAVLIFAEAKK
jgi:hypothetical protein